jgi:hypothetical protein
MRIVEWKLPIKADLPRALELHDLQFRQNDLVLIVSEEETGRIWKMLFKELQAFRVTTEECGVNTLAHLPNTGGLFEVLDSPWLNDLGRGEVRALEKSRHFVISCYDEIVEVVAWDFEVVEQTQ